MSRNKLLSDILVAYGGSSLPTDSRNTLLAKILTANGGTPTLNASRNKLLADIITQLGGSITNPDNRNSLLSDVTIAAGGVVINPNNRNLILGDWLAVAGLYGPELVVNGGFDTDSDWTLQNGATISGGLGNFAAVQSSIIQQTVSGISIGNSYRVGWEVVNPVNAGGAVWSGSGAWGSQPLNCDVIGNNQEVFTAVNNNARMITTGSIVGALSVDNISVRLIL